MNSCSLHCCVRPAAW